MPIRLLLHLLVTASTISTISVLSMGIDIECQGRCRQEPGADDLGLQLLGTILAVAHFNLSEQSRLKLMKVLRWRLTLVSSGIRGAWWSRWLDSYDASAEIEELRCVRLRRREASSFHGLPQLLKLLGAELGAAAVVLGATAQDSGAAAHDSAADAGDSCC